ncbi:hypothetical protein [Nocardia transvalensis]|uniref:hypothetical protein n=1 Tax=Nocardia transvalensis TaxID=37333 RepID=UPI00189400E6|nr:hypothetical protein [Nocardia transvalensis]MBF6330073.1 hypothetical protein [Nocardia transvalensis]
MIGTVLLLRRAAFTGVAIVALGTLSSIAGGPADATAVGCQNDLVNNGEGITMAEHEACKLGEQGDIPGCINALQSPPASRPPEVASAACVAANNPGNDIG